VADTDRRGTRREQGNDERGWKPSCTSVVGMRRGLRGALSSRRVARRGEARSAFIRARIRPVSSGLRGPVENSYLESYVRETAVAFSPQENYTD
jgi:hypothetical protein